MITDPRIGTELAGYRIDSLLGRGGMGVVYLATHTRLRRRAVLKLLAPELVAAPGFRDRFLRESEIAATMEHPSIVPVYDAGDEGGVLYLAMRYIEGTDLKHLLEEKGALGPSEALEILDPVAGALDAAHHQGLVHRDVKPANILIDLSGHAYLSDFGLTKRLSSDSGLTGTGQFIGTLDYAAPEQFEGKSLDARTDVYSLGCVLYECLTGQVPFVRDQDAALMYAHLIAPPPKLTERRPDLPEGIDRVVARAMAKDPASRYESAGALEDATRQALRPLTAPAPSRPAHRRSLLRRPVLVGAGALAVVLALIASVLLTRGGTPAGSPSPSASPANPALAKGDRLVRISQATGQVASDRFVHIRTGRDPWAVAIGEGSVWVANQTDATVARIDPVTNKVQAVVKVGPRPVAIAFGEGSVWVLNRLGHSVSRIDPGRNQVVATIEVDTSEPLTSIAVGEGAVWVAADSCAGPSCEPEIHRIDPRSNRDVATIQAPGGPLWVVVAAGEGAVWGADASGNLLRIDPSTNELGLVTNLGAAAAAITVAEGSLWIATLEGVILRVDPKDGEIQAQMPGSVVVTCAGQCASMIPSVVTSIAAGDGIIWVADKTNGAISRIATASNSPLVPITIGQTPTGVAVGYGSVWVTVDASG